MPRVRSSAPPTPLELGDFRAALGSWFDRDQRALPWRADRSVYRTVVSEFMLQQTQVATVRPYFERWTRALPDFAALAAAEEATVLKLWEGLGYYRRARNLHRLARILAALPAPPRRAVEWDQLPGIGAYTAAAIASLSFGEAVACVDGNVVRIVARLTGDEREFADGSAAVRHFTPLAAALLDPAQPGRHNEAMMELGATVCLRRQPLCTACPVLAHCAAGRGGFADRLPRIARPTTERQSVDRVWHVQNGALLLHRIPDRAARLHGLFELPTAAQAGCAPGALTPDRLLATHRRAITRFQITERIYGVDPPAGAVAETNDTLHWVALDELHTITLSGPHRLWINSLLAESPRVEPAAGLAR